jgi:hypothetical protein
VFFLFNKDIFWDQGLWYIYPAVMGSR